MRKVPLILFIVPTLFVMTWNEILFTFSVQKQTKTWTIFQNSLFLHCINLTEKNIDLGGVCFDSDAKD